MTTEPQPPLPLFYKAPELLSSTSHGAWRLLSGDMGFASATPFIPIVLSEIAAAASTYPVLFAVGDAQPVVMTGIEQANLFVAQGQWAEEAYVPAYIRRYPFGFIATVNPDGFALAIDAGSDRVAKDGVEGIALFEDGEPAELTRQALAFCDAFQRDATATRDFTDALREQNLLIDQRADVTLPDGAHRGIEGFQIVDVERFAKLPDDVVLDWHRKGWLALVHFHLMSLQRFQALLLRRSKQVDVSIESQISASSADLEDQNNLMFEKA